MNKITATQAGHNFSLAKKYIQCLKQYLALMAPPYNHLYSVWANLD